MKVDSPLRDIKGVGPKTQMLLEKLGLFTARDLITFFPRDYEHFGPPVDETELIEGQIGVVEGFVTARPKVRPSGARRIVTAAVNVNGRRVDMQWFNMPFLSNTLQVGGCYVFRGTCELRGSHMVLVQPEIYTAGEYEKKQDTLQPLYALTKGLTNKQIIRYMRLVLDELSGDDSFWTEWLPERIVQTYRLPGFREALTGIHFPKSGEALVSARRRLVFDEFFVFLYRIELQRRQHAVSSNGFCMRNTPQIDAFLRSLPFQLTDDQQKVWQEMSEDCEGPHLMNRMIQGEVGSGKTILAALGCLLAVSNGFQAAIMAPTEVLAEQHYRELCTLFHNAGVSGSICLLTGSLSGAQKRHVREQIARGDADLIIGTHALIQEQVEFARLAFVVTDEQHRFGVTQRQTLAEKGRMPHVLVMSATPIPRTLALLLYGDLDLSVIRQLPVGRLPIKNCVIPSQKRKSAYRFLCGEVAKGRQVYIICPLVEASESIDAENVTDYAEQLRHTLPPDIRISTLHGRMHGHEKNERMKQFANHEIDVLVSTTVIEVGVNVPNATVMIIENAERFGLAQLHQLRGRVGRGEHQSYCIFVNGSSQDAENERLSVMQQSNDGFLIAKKDLELRGPGDLLGVRQSGMMNFKIADVFADMDVLLEAKECVQMMFDKDSGINHAEQQTVMEHVVSDQNHLTL